MKKLTCFLWMIFLVSMFVFFVHGLPLKSFHNESFALINRIEGQVYDQHRNPVPEVNVQLLNEVDSLISYTKTNYVGRFTFAGISTGRFKVKVLPLGKGLLEQSQDVEILAGIRPTSSDTAYVEFFLHPDKKAADTLPQAPPEAIFVQTVPENAEKLFNDGTSDLDKNSDKGLSKIDEAIKIFPEYFAALSRLGKEYVLRKEYQKAFPYLMRAIDINPRSYSCYYRLGYAFYQLKEYAAAVEASKAAVTLGPGATDAQLLYGTVLRISEKYPEAEKVLVKANSLAKGLNADVHWQLALLYNRTNRNQMAIDELEGFLKLVPDAPEKVKIQELIQKLKTTAGSNKYNG